ncbi:hypothetical protein Ancab_028434 [Ancistrocladus abbreviatus]
MPTCFHLFHDEYICWLLCSDLELKPQGKLIVIVVKASDLKSMEIIRKSNPYVVLHVRALFKVKTKVVDDNLNPVWNETFELIAEDKETQSLIIEVFDEDIRQDKKLGITKLPLVDLEEEKEKVIELRLFPSLDVTKVKDKKDRGTITMKYREGISMQYKRGICEPSILVESHDDGDIWHHAALEVEKKILEERKILEDAEVIESTVEAIGGATFAVGSSVGMMGSGIGAGLGAGVGIVRTGLGAVGGGLSKEGRFMGRTTTRHSGGSKRGGSSTPVNSVQENRGMKPL